MRPRRPGPAGEPAVDADRDRALVRGGGAVALATLVSRLTGFVRALALAATIGLGLVNSSYTVANTLPTSVYQLLLGGVLTSVLVPTLVRAVREDGDGGDGFAQRLLCVCAVGLAAATLLATLAAPALVGLYLSDRDPAGTDLAVAFAHLLLPQIFGYGMGALFGALLNTRGVFGPAAWAPVGNNVVGLVALGVYWLLPRPPTGISTVQLLVLGIGTTLGIVAQAAVLLVALRRSGFRWRWRWGWDARLSRFARLAAWVVAYVLISQVGLAVTNRVGSAADERAIAIYANAWLLLQVPYGVLGVSLLTVLLPRMSAAAAADRIDRVVDDLGLGTRLSAVLLLPVSVAFTVFGPALGVALFSAGRTGTGAAALLGETLAVSAFGLLPLAAVMLQLRTFYALDDARTPTLIMVVMTAVKVPTALLVPALLPPERVVLGLAVVNSAVFVLGAAVGWARLRVRLGPLPGGPVLSTILRTGVAAAAAATVAALVVAALDRQVPAIDPIGLAWRTLLVGGAVGAVLLPVGLWVLRVTEQASLIRTLARR